MQYKSISVTFKRLKPADISAGALILSLLSAAEASSMTVAQLSAAGALFGIDTTAIRMALSRLAREGRVRSPGRGAYALGGGAQALNERAVAWRRATEAMAPWPGDWLGVLTVHIGRTDRKAVRARERALRLYGFAEAGGGAWVRPANLAFSLSELRSAMGALGLPRTATFIRISECLEEDAACWRALWPADILRQGYRTACDEMEASLRRLPALALQDAARESYLLGQSVIRAINLDPLLPQGISDSKGFARMHGLMQTYDRTGRAIWRRFFAGA